MKAQESSQGLQQRLSAHVHKLAVEIGERNVAHPVELARTATYIEQNWREQGYDVVRQSYDVEGVTCANLKVSREGKDHPDQILLVGAHYDSVQGSPGANDNGTGVAALLELSRFFESLQPQRTIRFVAFVNEEPPYFFTRNQGSRRYAREARRRSDHIRLMISLETIGCFRDEPGSQDYPPFFRFFYPDRGDFIAFVSNLRYRRVLNRFRDAFHDACDFPFQAVAVPGWIPGVAWSDHLSFWRERYPALMVTDTAFYRYPYYHTAGDKPEHIDFPRFAHLTRGLGSALVSLAGQGP